MWKKLRIIILLLVLLVVAANTYMTRYRAQSWDETLWVAIYPINYNSDTKIDHYIKSLSDFNYELIDTFYQREARRVDLKIDKPFKYTLAHRVDELPPSPPGRDSNMFEIALWSLKLRYWAYQQDASGFSPHIKIFVIYHSYEQEEALEHSLGLEKGMIGVVHAYAHSEMEGKNNLVIAHEVLHTIGATDKYDLASGIPIYPEGYAEPDSEPVLPQRHAELMGATIPLTETESEMPRSLKRVMLGRKTLQEINWLQRE